MRLAPGVIGHGLGMQRCICEDSHWKLSQMRLAPGVIGHGLGMQRCICEDSQWKLSQMRLAPGVIGHGLGIQRCTCDDSQLESHTNASLSVGVTAGTGLMLPYHIYVVVTTSGSKFP